MRAKSSLASGIHGVFHEADGPGEPVTGEVATLVEEPATDEVAIILGQPATDEAATVVAEPATDEAATVVAEPAAGEAATVPAEPATAEPAASPRGATGLRAYWFSPVGVAVILATMLAFGLRVFVLFRPGMLTGITEYDDGVYLGAAIRLTEGALPYRDYALVQPPGILILMVPAGVVARVYTTAAALGVVRVLTVCASTACVPLAGNLMRYRGMVGTVVTCGFLAAYPDDVWTAHTLLLEPWLNLCCLIGVNAAFRRGRLAGPWRLAWAGVALGFAGSVKYWAVVPALVLLATCLITRQKQRPWRTRACLAGLVVGFAVPIAPFALATPVTFFRSTVLDQASRVGSPVPIYLRLAHLTGLVDIFNIDGHFSLAGGTDSLALNLPSPTAAATVQWLPFMVIGVIAAAIAIGYCLHWRRPSQLEWFALAVAVLATAAILAYSAFFYHYPAFVAPWLALALGGAAGCLTDRVTVRGTIVVLAAAASLAVASAEVHQLIPVSGLDGSQVVEVIPAGSCVVTDQVSDLISVDRLDNPPGCPDVIDSLATTLVLGNGVSTQAGAAGVPAVMSGWQSILDGAQYVLLSNGFPLRIPLDFGWFQDNFAPVSAYVPGIGQLYERRSPPLPAASYIGPRMWIQP